MKCEFCGSPLTLKDEVCPYCGKPNEQVKRHVSDMKRYQGEFEDTKHKVYHTTKRYTRITVRVVTAAILLVIAVVLLVAAGNAYEIHSALQRQQMKRHYQEYTQILDNYLAEENYQAFHAFCTRHEIWGFDDGYEKYAPIENTSRLYSSMYEQIMQIAFPPSYMEGATESYVSNLADNMNYFYESADISRYEYYEGADNEVNRQALQTMKKQVEMLLVTYCKLTAEEAESLEGLSEAKRAVLLEEALAR